MVNKSLRSIFVAILMGLSAYFGSLVYQCLHLWLALVSPKAFRWYIDMTMFMWICSSISLLEWIVGLKFRLFGDKIIPSERAIFIMNHRTRLDWLYFYGILMRFGFSLKDEKIVLKRELKRIPGPGWAMQCASYIFLERKLDSDKCHISNMINYFADVNHNTKILIFPEGTDFSPFSRDRSNRYADKMGLPHYEYLLHPRTSGFVHFVEEMVRCYPKFDAIYDVTAAYPDKGFATNEQEFLMGKSSSEIHFHCRRYSLKEIVGCENQFLKSVIPNELSGANDVSEKLKAFVIKIWEEKEKILGNYYGREDKSMSFHGVEVQMESVLIKQLISVFLICGNIFTCLYALYIIPKVSIPIFLILNAIFIYFDLFRNGVDDLVMKYALNHKNKSLNRPLLDGIPGNKSIGKDIKEE